MDNTTLAANALVAMVCLFAAFWVFISEVNTSEAMARCRSSSASEATCFNQINR